MMCGLYLGPASPVFQEIALAYLPGKTPMMDLKVDVKWLWLQNPVS